VTGVKLSTSEVFVCDGVFVAIGHNPATEIFKGQVELDEKGFVKPHPKSLSLIQERDYKLMTNVAGVFTAGDVHDAAYKQAITAAGYGCQAALEVEKWLVEK
jgi:thioredoxin reductase (NADPH)